MKVFGSWRDWPSAEADLAGRSNAGQFNTGQLNAGQFNAGQFNKDTVVSLAAAYAFAADRHTGQTRPAGEPYTWHLLEALEIAVDSGVTDADVLVAALLHDVVEDTPTTLDEVRTEFGERTAELVGWVTRPRPVAGEKPAEVRTGYLARFAGAPLEVLTVKLSDRYSNVQRLDTHPRPAKQAAYYAETVRHFVPLAAQIRYFDALFCQWRHDFAHLAADAPADVAPGPADQYGPGR